MIHSTMARAALAAWHRVFPEHIVHTGALRAAMRTAFRTLHGDEARWLAALNALPTPTGREAWCVDEGDRAAVRNDAQTMEQAVLRQHLMALSPWRKGPFDFFGVRVDAEWQSNLKWERVLAGANAVGVDFEAKDILDLGCGNGYYGFQMLAQGARRVLGLDTSLLCAYQHAAFMRYCADCPSVLLPLSFDDFPTTPTWDVVVSMGVLAHRPDPMAHLQRARAYLKKTGVLVLETLIAEAGSVMPPGRYAAMPNVWWLPDIDTLKIMLTRAGFGDVVIADVSTTETTEQRTTDWMRFHSLAESLDDKRPNQTIEGLPRPRRAVVFAVCKDG